MSWEKPDETISRLLDKKLVDFDCEKKKMFGYPIYFINNNMFTGVHGKNLFMRFSIAEIGTLLKENGISPFEPRDGMIMKEYIVIDRSIIEDSKRFSDLLNRSYAYTLSLPPKVKKNRSKKNQ